MRITRIATALLATAAAGVFLAGCSGSSDTATTAIQTSPTAVFTMPSGAGSPVPTVAPVPTTHTQPLQPRATAGGTVTAGNLAPATTPAPVTTTVSVDSTPVAFAMQSQDGPCEGTITVNSAGWTPAGLVINVTDEATSGSVQVSSSYWQARDAQGNVYKAEFAPYPGPQPALAFGDITAGVKSRGFILIVAPQGALTIEMNTIGYTRVAASWTVPAV